ncbi:MAG: hypothetical protein GY948_21805 [Alphaproteobacteria bacterium]|nr:hypothetical protein [Alphaproteobacteria bacterium]
MKRAVSITALLLVCSSGPGLAETCGAPADWLALAPEGGTTFKAALSVGSETPKVGAPFDVELKVCSPDNRTADRLAVDATMPAHKHGMNYQPQLTKAAEGHYKATGFLFHMPGIWQITVSVYSNGKPNHLSVDIDVP